MEDGATSQPWTAERGPKWSIGPSLRYPQTIVSSLMRIFTVSSPRSVAWLMAAAALMWVACGEDPAEQADETTDDPVESAEEAEPEVPPPPVSLGTEAGVTYTLSNVSAQALALSDWREERWLVSLGRTSIRDDGSERTVFHIYDRNLDGTAAFEPRALEESNYPVGQLAVAAASSRGIALAWLEGAPERNGRIQAWVRRRSFDVNVHVQGPGRRVYREEGTLTGTEFRAGGRAAIALGAGGRVLVTRATSAGGLVAATLDAGNEPVGEPVRLSPGRAAYPSLAQAPDGSGVLVWVDVAEGRIRARRFDAELALEEATTEVAPSASMDTMGPAAAGRPRVAVGPEGDFVVAYGAPATGAWQDSYRMVLMVRHFGADDEPLDAATAVSPVHPLTLDGKYLNTHAGTRLEYRVFDVAMGPGGANAVVFLSSAAVGDGRMRQLAVYVQRYSRAGEPQGLSLPVAPVRETDVVVQAAAAADESSRLAVAWVAGPNVLFRVYDVGDEAPAEEEEEGEPTDG